MLRLIKNFVQVFPKTFRDTLKVRLYEEKLPPLIFGDTLKVRLYEEKLPPLIFGEEDYRTKRTPIKNFVQTFSQAWKRALKERLYEETHPPQQKEFRKYLERANPPIVHVLPAYLAIYESPLKAAGYVYIPLRPGEMGDYWASPEMVKELQKPQRDPFQVTQNAT